MYEFKISGYALDRSEILDSDTDNQDSGRVHKWRKHRVTNLDVENGSTPIPQWLWGEQPLDNPQRRCTCRDPLIYVRGVDR
eukprot:1195435-Prorocentrum_minimum.AAC.10